MKRLSLRVRLTLLFFLLTSAAWGIAYAHGAGADKKEDQARPPR